MATGDVSGGIWKTTTMDGPAADSFDFTMEDGAAEAAVPFHRVINNTIFGGETPSGDGVGDEIPVVVRFFGDSGADPILTDGAAFDTGPELF